MPNTNDNNSSDTVFVNGQGYSVAPELQKRFILRKQASGYGRTSRKSSSDTVFVNGQGYSVAPELQKIFILRKQASGYGRTSRKSSFDFVTPPADEIVGTNEQREQQIERFDYIKNPKYDPKRTSFFKSGQTQGEFEYDYARRKERELIKNKLIDLDIAEKEYLRNPNTETENKYTGAYNAYQGILIGKEGKQYISPSIKQQNKVEARAAFQSLPLSERIKLMKREKGIAALELAEFPLLVARTQLNNRVGKDRGEEDIFGLPKSYFADIPKVESIYEGRDIRIFGELQYRPRETIPLAAVSFGAGSSIMNFKRVYAAERAFGYGRRAAFLEAGGSTIKSFSPIQIEAPRTIVSSSNIPSLMERGKLFTNEPIRMYRTRTTQVNKGAMVDVLQNPTIKYRDTPSVSIRGRAEYESIRPYESFNFKTGKAQRFSLTSSSSIATTYPENIFFSTRQGRDSIYGGGGRRSIDIRYDAPRFGSKSIKIEPIFESYSQRIRSGGVSRRLTNRLSIDYNFQRTAEPGVKRFRRTSIGRDIYIRDIRIESPQGTLEYGRSFGQFRSQRRAATTPTFFRVRTRYPSLATDLSGGTTRMTRGRSRSPYTVLDTAQSSAPVLDQKLINRSIRKSFMPTRSIPFPTQLKTNAVSLRFKLFSTTRQSNKQTSTLAPNQNQSIYTNLISSSKTSGAYLNPQSTAQSPTLRLNQRQAYNTRSILSNFNAPGAPGGSSELLNPFGGRIPRPPNRPTSAPPFSFELGRYSQRSGTRKLRSRKRPKYTPSYKALILGIRGKQTRGVFALGVRERPITPNFSFAYSQ